MHPCAEARLCATSQLAAKADILPSGNYGLVLGAEYLLKGALAQDVTVL
jgi:hypothetical protein